MCTFTSIFFEPIFLCLFAIQFKAHVVTRTDQRADMIHLLLYWIMDLNINKEARGEEPQELFVLFKQIRRKNKYEKWSTEANVYCSIHVTDWQVVPRNRLKSILFPIKRTLSLITLCMSWPTNVFIPTISSRYWLLIISLNCRRCRLLLWSLKKADGIESLSIN